jgi:hypothetical protein
VRAVSDGNRTVARRFKIGDRVEIVAEDHPWHGHQGTIVAPFAFVDLEWCVELDGGEYPGHQSACAESDLAPTSELGGTR